MAEQIILCIPTLTQYDLCIKEIRSAENGTVKPDKYVVIDNGGAFAKHLEGTDLSCFIIDKLDVINPEKNLGCAKSWNVFLKNYEGILIIANDDLTFEPDAIEHLVECYKTEKDNPLTGMVTLHGINANSHYGCFIVTPTAIKTVGYFDETFYPAYYEDCDYDYRLRTHGLETVFSKKGTYDHVGSATHKALTPEQLESHHITFVKNRDYYEAKWGGELNKEKFITPFGKEI